MWTHCCVHSWKNESPSLPTEGSSLPFFQTRLKFTRPVRLHHRSHGVPETAAWSWVSVREWQLTGEVQAEGKEMKDLNSEVLRSAKKDGAHPDAAQADSVQIWWPWYSLLTPIYRYGKIKIIQAIPGLRDMRGNWGVQEKETSKRISKDL